MLDTIRRLLLPAAAGLLALCVVLPAGQQSSRGAEPPTIDPFGRKPAVREDSVPGYVEMSDEAVHPGQIYLTRDMRLKIFDEQLQRQREIPLRAVKQIQCKVKREWMEKEWKFKQAASSEKIFTGRTYPAREYLHTITLRDDRTITGPVSAIVYVQPDPHAGSRTAAGQPGAYPGRAAPERYLLHKRNKGEVGGDLKSLVYVKLIKLGDDALAEGRKKAAQRRARKTGPQEQPRRGSASSLPPTG
jgi:hypothetical protein